MASAPPPTSAPDSRTAAAVRQDLARITLAVLCLLLLIGGSLWILRPFAGALVWATMLVVTTWPLLKSLEARLGHRRGPAVAVMTVAMLLLLIVPLWAAIATLVGSADEVTSLARQLAETGLPQPPGWVAGLPLVGDRVSAAWTQASATGPEGVASQLAPHVGRAVLWVLGKLGSAGGTLLQFLVVVVLSAILYTNGETAARAVRRFGRRVAGDRGENAVVLAGQAIRGVALGVGATAIVQTVLGSLGLLLAGVPLVALLTAAMLLLCIAQLGPALVLFPAVAWVYWTGDHTWATVLLAWSVLVTLLDNFLRPVLIKKGADLPLLLILAGVIGGLFAFGLVGIFVGPVVLAVSYTLLDAWIEDGLREA
ncbi:MAG TPA: AI-2E family transporter YdiK [Vicinamibacteria bacterium]